MTPSASVLDYLRLLAAGHGAMLTDEIAAELRPLVVLHGTANARRLLALIDEDRGEGAAEVDAGRANGSATQIALL